MFPTGKNVCGSLKNKAKSALIRGRSPLCVRLGLRTEYFPTLFGFETLCTESFHSDRCSNRKTAVYFVAFGKTRAVYQLMRA